MFFGLVLLELGAGRVLPPAPNNSGSLDDAAVSAAIRHVVLDEFVDFLAGYRQFVLGDLLENSGAGGFFF